MGTQFILHDKQHIDTRTNRKRVKIPCGPAAVTVTNSQGSHRIFREGAKEEERKSEDRFWCVRKLCLRGRTFLNAVFEVCIMHTS